MKIVVIGGTGTIGSVVADRLSRDHQVIRASRHGEIEVDITRPESIRTFYDAVGEVDAVVSCAGEVVFGHLDEVSDADMDKAMYNKLLGEVNVVRIGQERLGEGASFTLVTGQLAEEPAEGTSIAAMVNAGLNAFVRGAAIELEKKGMRCNGVSPGKIRETLEEMGEDPSQGVPLSDVAETFARAVEGNDNGAILEPEEVAATA